MEFLCSFLRHHLAGKPVVASRIVGCFLRLPQAQKLELHTKQIVSTYNAIHTCESIVPFAVGRLNCRIPYKLWYYWQDWYLTLTKFEKRSVLVAMGLLELPDLRHTLVDIGTTLLCISGYNGLPGRTLPIFEWSHYKIFVVWYTVISRY